MKPFKLAIESIQAHKERIQELEQKLIGWPDLFDENMQLKAELEQYRSIAEQIGASKAVSELEQANARIKELESDRKDCKQCAAEATARIVELEQQLEEAHTELLVSIKERLVLGGQNAELEQQLTARFAENKELYGHWQNAIDQNAKLIEALKNIKSDNRPFIDSLGRFALPRELAAAVLKEMEVKDA
jgi:chromosome segregation ATPase